MNKLIVILSLLISSSAFADNTDENIPEGASMAPTAEGKTLGDGGTTGTANTECAELLEKRHRLIEIVRTGEKALDAPGTMASKRPVERKIEAAEAALEVVKDDLKACGI